jgi:hypothetical protein
MSRQSGSSGDKEKTQLVPDRLSIGDQTPCHKATMTTIGRISDLTPTYCSDQAILS